MQLCGDAHVLNFRLWATPERTLASDVGAAAASAAAAANRIVDDPPFRTHLEGRSDEASLFLQSKQAV